MASSAPPQGHATSAIPGMTVAEIRRALSRLRELWTNATPESPLFVCDKLHNDKSIAEFSKEFIFGHHLKRHFKSVMQATINKRKPAAPQSVKMSLAPHVVSVTPATTTSVSNAVPGPKGDANDPFPFTAAWKPKTQRGKRAFEQSVMAHSAPVSEETPQPPTASSSPQKRVTRQTSKK